MGSSGSKDDDEGVGSTSPQVSPPRRVSRTTKIKILQRNDEGILEYSEVVFSSRLIRDADTDADSKDRLLNAIHRAIADREEAEGGEGDIWVYWRSTRQNRQVRGKLDDLDWNTGDFGMNKFFASLLLDRHFRFERRVSSNTA
jgi:hypothetical protein